MMNWWQKLLLKMFLNKKGVKEMLEKIQAAISGKKTYILMVLSIIGTIVAWSQNQIDTTKAIELIIASITGITMRGAITKSGPTCPPVNPDETPKPVQ